MSSTSQLSSATPASRISHSAWIANGLLAAAFAGYCIVDAIEWGGRQEGYAAAGVAMTATLVIGAWALVLSTRALRKRESFWIVFLALSTTLALLNAWVIKTAFFGSEVVQYAKVALIHNIIPVLVPWFSLLVLSVILVVRVLSQRTRLKRRALVACALLPIAVWIFLLPVPLFIYFGYWVGHLRYYSSRHVSERDRMWISLLDRTPELHAELGAICASPFSDLYPGLIATGRVSEARLKKEAQGRDYDEALAGLSFKNRRLAAQLALPFAESLPNTSNEVDVALGEGSTIDELIALLKNPKVSQNTKYRVLYIFDRTFPTSRGELAEKALENYGVDHLVPYSNEYFAKERNEAEVLRLWSKLLAIESRWDALSGIDFYVEAPEKFRPAMFDMLLERGKFAMLWAAFHKAEYKRMSFTPDQMRKLLLKTVEKLDDFALGKRPPSPNILSHEYVDGILYVAKFTGLEQEKAAEEQTIHSWIGGTLPDAQYKLLIQNFCQKVREKLKEEKP